jgi:GNAT superfamily N-acetyltransferase
MRTISIKLLKYSYISIIVDGFAKSNWTKKPANIFEKYLEEQNNQRRIILVAYLGDQFAGYVTLKWKSQYKPFANMHIPEICDLNLLPDFRNIGIGSQLLEQCERIAATKSDIVGVGVGLYADYGAAQRLYVKRLYIPNGLGVTYNYHTVLAGKNYPIDDDLVLWFSKQLKN